MNVNTLREFRYANPRRVADEDQSIKKSKLWRRLADGVALNRETGAIRAEVAVGSRKTRLLRDERSYRQGDRTLDEVVADAKDRQDSRRADLREELKAAPEPRPPPRAGRAPPSPG